MNLSAIQKKIYRLTKTNATSYVVADLTDDLNIAYNRVTSLIIQADGRWQWDDDNQLTTDQGNGVGGQQNGTTALVANQQDYTFPVTYLKVNRIEILPNGGNFFYKLFPRDVQDPVWNSEFNGIDTTTKGAPMYYDITGHSVFLYPIPNYSQNASLKFYFQRGQIDFLTADVTTGTLTPGFASLFHDLLCYLVAYDYAVINLPQLAPDYFAVIQRKEADLKEYYAHRNKDDGNQLTMRGIIYS